MRITSAMKIAGVLSAALVACAPRQDASDTDTIPAGANVGAPGTGASGTGSAVQDTMQLRQGEWVVTDINGTAAATGEPGRATMQFAADGRVGGNTTCNSYSGPYTINGRNMDVSQIVSTKRACVDPVLMDQERRFVDVLDKVEAWSISADTTLMLVASDGSRITAKRRKPGQLSKEGRTDATRA